MQRFVATQHVIIVGGGTVGTAVALRLIAAGYRVTIVDLEE
jgi:2-polyprenyl-6-methoxyphenol hydroxylase-like FAD-dependent oxidoreductase